MQYLSKMQMAGLIVVGALTVVVSACGGGSGGGIPVTMTLSASPVTPSEAQLSWSAHPDTVTGYDLYRNGTAAYPTHLAGTSYTDRELEPLGNYCYVVYAVVFPLGIVGRSNEVCITTAGTAGWTIETIAPGNSPALALDSSNQPHVSLRNSNGVLLASRSGSSWQTATVDAGAGVYGETDLVIDPAGADHVSYADASNDRLVHASNATGVWLTEIADTAVGNVNALALDLNGHIHLAYDSDEAYTGVVSYATDASGAWVTQRLVGYSNAAIRDSDILVDGTGVVHLSYTVAGLTCYVYYSENSGSGWSEQILENDGNCGAALALDSNGNVHIVYTRKFALLHAHNTGGVWQYEQIDSFSWLGGDKVALAIDSADHLHIAYRDQNADLKYATNVSGLWENKYLDCIGQVGYEPSIAVDASGRIIVVYTDQTKGTVKLVTSP